MTAIVAPILGKQISLLGGSEKIGPMTFPVFGVGKMAGKPIADCQGIGISSQSKNKEVAADFLRFVHDRTRVEALWTMASAIPNDEFFDTQPDRGPGDARAAQPAGWKATTSRTSRT